MHPIQRPLSTINAKKAPRRAVQAANKAAQDQLYAAKHTIVCLQLLDHPIGELQAANDLCLV